MPDALKNIYSPEFVAAFAALMKKTLPAFNSRKFITETLNENWERMELKQRMHHITLILHRFLPQDFPEALKIILDATERARTGKLNTYGIAYLFFPDYVETFGIDHPDLSLRSFEELTSFVSCEFAVRPFIKKYPERAMEQMQQWSFHQDHHVRRFSSEGCRPRLPWAMALPDLKKDPSPILPILDQLKTDPSEYVRRSVANNLNDISKDHPQLVAKLVKDWQGKNRDTDWILRHGSRSLLKKADKDIYSLFGLSEKVHVQITDFVLSKKQLKIGEDMRFSFSLAHLHKKPVRLRIDFGVGYQKSNGKVSWKTFRISENIFNPSSNASYDRKLSFRNLTTRKHYPGKHELRIIVNGKTVASEEILLRS